MVREHGDTAVVATGLGEGNSNRHFTPDMNMAHWTDDPQIHSLMTYLGKVGTNGNPTRLAFIADQMNRLLVQVETRLSEHRRIAKEADDMTADLDRNKKFVAERTALDRELRESIREAQQDLLSQNPKADTLQLDRDAAEAVNEFEDEQEKAAEQIEELTKSVTMKRTALRRTDDRIEHYRKQVYALLAEASKGNKSIA